MDLTRAEEPWVAYAALVDLEGADANDPRVAAAYERLRRDPRVAELIGRLATWATGPFKAAYDPKDAIWALSVLADFGLRKDDPRIADLAERLFAAQAENGGFLHGGFDHTRSWHQRPYVCIDHVQTYALARFGYRDDPRLHKAYEHIHSSQRPDGGWHPNEARAPNEPSCPFGTLNVLRALVAHPLHVNSSAAKRAAELILTCWQRRDEPYRPVGFGIGQTWAKLQYPFVQYQHLKTLDTLSQVPGVPDDPRYTEMLRPLRAKQTQDAAWWAEGVNKPYADFDFGQKKQPSPWITLVALRILQRSERSDIV